jgi:PTS system nitrogen regulatory IIA component
MDIAQLLSSSGVVADLAVASKKQALVELARIAAPLVAEPGAMETTPPDDREIFEVLLERERLGTTGVGSGIAIPHGKLRGLTRLTGLFARLAKPVDFESIDDQPVDLVFVLLAPEAAGADHLKALAKVSRLLRDKTICDRLRRAPDAEKLFAILTEAPSAPAA